MDDAFQPFSVAPRLQRAHLSFDWNGPIVPTAQLTYLSARPRDFGLCLDILRSSSSLVEASFSQARPTDVTSLTPVTALQLRSLKLFVRSGSSSLILGLLYVLTLPSLCELGLAAAADTDNVSIHTSLISLVGHHAP
jgi:hypothetical protein